MEALGIESRFWIQRELGRGAKSLVVDVWDALHDVRRALKIATSKDARDAFEAEYRMLTELRHPHVVRAYDFGVSRTGLPYYTLELIDGVAFDAFPHRGDVDVLVPLAMQILEALAALHLRGIVHRDLKPRNVLIAGEGAASLARVIDLGLATRGAERGSGGTLPYMAPEAARGDEVDGRADLYALGVMLYEALVPDAATVDLTRVAARHVAAPVAPDEVNPLTPHAFADFVRRLMEPDPDGRYSSAFEAAAALDRCSASLHAPVDDQTSAERLMRGGAVAHRPEELATLLALADEARTQNRPRAAVIVGREGIGKTPLLRELGVHLCTAGFRVAQFRTSSASDAPLDLVLRAAHALRPDVVAEVTPDWTRSRAAATSFAHRDPNSFVTRLSSLLVDVFGDVPTALLVDDVQRAETIALEVVRHMAAKTYKAPLFVVCVSDVDTRPLGDEATTLVLQPLGSLAVAALTAHRVHGLNLPPPALGRLLADGRGEPSLVERTLARFFVDGLVVRRAGKFVFAGGRYRAQSKNPRDAWESRVAGLVGVRARAAFAAAVLGTDIAADRVAAITADDVGETARALAELAREGFLVPAQATSRPGYVFARRAIAQVLYERVPAEVLRRYHDDAAKLFEPSAGEAPSVELIEHVLRGSDRVRAVTLAIDAGDRAARVFADKRAVEYYSRAYDRLGGVSDARAAGVATRLARSFERTGELKTAMDWYNAALVETRDRDRATSIEATLGLARVLLASGMPGEAARHAATVLSLVDAAMPHFQAAALRIQASAAIDAGEHAVAAERLARANEILEQSLAPLFAFKNAPEASEAALTLSIEVQLELARLARRRGELAKAVRHAKRALRRARAVGDPSAIAAASAVMARGLARAGRLPSARRALFAGLRGVRASGDRLREAGILRELGHLRLREGNIDAALERYATSLEAMRSLKAHADESACLSDISFVRTIRGEFRAAEVASDLAVSIARDCGDVRSLKLAQLQAAHTRVWVGDLGAAQALLDELVAASAGADVMVHALGSAIKAWVDARLHATAAAHAFVDRLAAGGGRLEDPSPDAVVLLYAGAAALSLHRLTEAQTFADAMARVVHAARLSYFRAPAGLLYGSVCVATGAREAGIEAFRQALGHAVEQRLRPFEIIAKLALAELSAGTDAATEHLTSAMECLETMVHDLPPETARLVLASEAMVRLRQAFLGERRRVLGR